MWVAKVQAVLTCSSPSSLLAGSLACLQSVHDLNAHLQMTIYEFLILFPMAIFSFLHSESSLIKQNKDVTVNYYTFRQCKNSICVYVLGDGFDRDSNL